MGGRYKCLISTTLEVPIDMIITPQIEAAACARFKIPEWKWEEAKKKFPHLLAKDNQKRLRRMEYALETGTSANSRQ
jgi:hypothetical protein